MVTKMCYQYTVLEWICIEDALGAGGAWTGWRHCDMKSWNVCPSILHRQTDQREEASQFNAGIYENQ